MKIVILWMSLFLATGCSYFSWFSGDVEEVVGAEAKSNDGGARNDVEKISSAEAKTSNENQSKRKADGIDDDGDDEKNQEKGEGFFSTITSILPVGSSDKKSSADEDSKLQIARLIARVEELTIQVIKMQSRMVVVEKSVHLGISPEALSSKRIIDRQENAEFVALDATSVDGDSTGSAHHSSLYGSQHASASLNSDTEKSSRFSNFEEDLKKAVALFRKGEYGSAYVSFSNIDSTYTESVKQGLPSYWIARSWFRLREYQSAKKHFSQYIRKYPTSVQAPMAKYYLANIDSKLGLPRSAVSLLQEVIREHPNGAAADASRRLIAEMSDAL